MLDVLNSIKSMVETSSLVNGVAVDFKLSKDERYLLCDESQIKQVILNICKNAVDAMSEKNDARLTIETGFIVKSCEMFIKISDNGYGISKEDLKKVGTPFFTTKRTGTGLGLSMCKQIIKAHKGKMKVDSEIGVGTTFTLLLPCIKDDASEEPA
jgi:signal transduction histidine kinase